MSVDCSSSSAGTALREASQSWPAIEHECVEVVLDRRRPDDLAIGDKMQVGVFGNLVTQSLGAVEQPLADRPERRHVGFHAQRAVAA